MEQGKNKDGIEGGINIISKLLDQAICDCLANTCAYDYYIKPHMKSCILASISQIIL